jgi:quinol monooxygenase YgiN/quercetin dioxygenase-like cupin family protein
MPAAARHVEFTALAGRGDDLAAALVAAAEALRGTPGCEAWVVARVAGEPDVVCVDERWRDRETMDAAARDPEAADGIAAVRALLAPDAAPVVRELEPVGGPGMLAPPRPGVTHRSLLDSEDQTPGFGMASMGEARFPTPDLGLERAGVAHYRIAPGQRQPFGHRHAEAEELYLVLGAGRVRLDDEVRELADRDALRVAPAIVRCFEAGPDGMELLAVGPRHPSDGEMLMGWWAGEPGSGAA